MFLESLERLGATGWKSVEWSQGTDSGNIVQFVGSLDLGDVTFAANGIVRGVNRFESIKERSGLDPSRFCWFGRLSDNGGRGRFDVCQRFLGSVFDFTRAAAFASLVASSISLFAISRAFFI